MRQELLGPSDPALVSRFRSFSKITAGVAVLIGCAVLCGWIFDIAFLKSILPGLVSMKPNTAIGLLLIGMSLWMRHGPLDKPWTRHLAQGFAGLAVLMGLLTLCEYVFNWNPGIDTWLFGDSSTVGTTHPGRMAPRAAINFILLGFVLIVLDLRRWQTVIHIATLAVLLNASLALIGYAYDVSAFYDLASSSWPSLHTAGAFLLLSLGTLFARPNRGWMALFATSTAGGIMIRRLLPATLLIPLVFGWLRLQGERMGLYGSAMGTISFTTVTAILLTLVIWWNARSLNRLDAERRRVLEERDRFFDLSMDMICIADFNGYFRQVNPAWEQTLGWSREELLSRPYQDFLHPDDIAVTSAESDKIHKGARTTHFENRYRHKDGSYRWFQWTATPALEQKLTYATARDVTEQKLAEEDIRRLNEDLLTANKELESFSYSVSHDLRAPLRAIDGFSKILGEDHSDRLDEEGKRLLAVVRGNTQKMGQLIDDLLSFSRLGRKELQAEELNITELARSVFEELKTAYPKRHFEVHLDSVPAHRADRAMMRQVLMNLFSNALKFTQPRESARIEFGHRSDDGQDIYFLKDNGVGFDMKYAGKLFGVFQRLHSPEEFDGTGVGLAIVQRVIHRHGGRVWAEGTVDKGATFYFSLPQDPEPQIDSLKPEYVMKFSP